ncbi:hypothetical protein AB0I81_34805 [Nonomuraea sp. NPDC050404]|uniref:hypothetical protein n=1 Tax=Nonomuraea sp. NPDC050404 TaxID=3155783 RepID=UPI0033E882EF
MKQSGLGDRLVVAGYDLSGDINSLGRIGGGNAPLEVTGIDKSAKERIGGLRDGAIEFTSYFNPVTERAHERFSSLPTSDQVVTYLRGTTLGNAAACMVAKQINYDGSRGDSGEFTFDVQALANSYGLEWGTQLTAGVRTDTTATSGDSIDFGAATSYGLQAYLHVTAFTGTSVTVKLQESSDDGDSDSWADVTGGGFTAATGVTSQRITTARDQDVEQYLRVVTTGTFSSASFVVVVVKNDLLTVF